jgi:electron transfer flavoprotein alpha/beta subunit
MGIRKANRAQIPVWTASDLGPEDLPGEAKADWGNISALPARDTSAEIIAADSVEEQAKILADRLFEEKVI